MVEEAVLGDFIVKADPAAADAFIGQLKATGDEQQVTNIESVQRLGLIGTLDFVSEKANRHRRSVEIGVHSIADSGDSLFPAIITCIGIHSQA